MVQGRCTAVAERNLTACVQVRRFVKPCAGIGRHGCQLQTGAMVGPCLTSYTVGPQVYQLICLL